MTPKEKYDSDVERFRKLTPIDQLSELEDLLGKLVDNEIDNSEWEKRH